MACIVPYNEKYGYFESMYDNYIHNTHEAAKYIHLDAALRIGDYLKSEYDGDCVPDMTDNIDDAFKALGGLPDNMRSYGKVCGVRYDFEGVEPCIDAR